MVGNLEDVMGAPRVVRLLSLGALYLLLSPPATAQNQRLSAFKSETALHNYFRDIVRDRLRYIDEQEKKRCGNYELSITRKKSRLPATIIAGLVRDSRSKTPVHGALIQGGKELAAHTTPDGRFRLAIPIQDPKQPAQVTIRAIGYSTRSFQVRAGDSVEVLAPMCVSPYRLEEAVVTASASSSVTNTQHAGVDEGGIVKLHGNHLVILRRGRLFTVAVGDTALRPVAAVDAFDPELSPQSTEYDEMLIYRDKVVVVGYSYRRTTTELGIFQIDARGGLRYLTTYQLRSHDYYSARNYASRLIGSRLVFYTPFYLGLNLKDPLGVMPAMRRWGVEKDKGRFERLVTPQTVFRTDWQPSPREWVVVHTVTVCDLDGDPLPCTASAVIGGADRSFYVSPSAVYVWAGQGGETDSMPNATLLRFGIDRLQRPGAMAVQGSPIDQFSFLEGNDGWLNVLVQSRRRGDAMWRSERQIGNLALLRVSLKDFGETLRQTRQAEYRELPKVTGVLHNRFVGDHLLFGAGNGWIADEADTASLFVVPVAGGRLTRLQLPHGADRIEVMGKDAAVIGESAEDLLFTGVALGKKPELVQRLTLRGASQGEQRSHGFFYRATGNDGGVIGLPFRGAGQAGWAHLIKGSAGIVFVENRNDRFTQLGVLEAAADTTKADHCKSWLSCVDWYGNARPLFVGQRVFALMGYELVEGVLKDQRIQEVRRVDFGGSQTPPR